MHKSSLFASLPGLALLLGTAIAAAYYGATLIAAFLLLIFLLCSCARIWSRNVLKKAEISIDDGQTACHAGDSMPITLRLRSRSFFPLIWLDVILHLGDKPILLREGDDPAYRFVLPEARPFVGLRERFVWLLWQQEITCEETLQALHRGIVTTDRVSLQAGDGLGMAACLRWLQLKRPVRLVVYPRLMHVDISPFLKHISDAETGKRGQTEDITLLKSSRPYQHGDPMKRINWRYLAMSGRMEINQYETITPGCITFFLDLFSFRYKESYSTTQGQTDTRIVLRETDLERMISLIASCIQKLSEQGLRFALVIPGYGQTEPVICPPASGETALFAAMEALASVCYNGEEILLPVDEIRRKRRKFGTMYLCAWSDVPTQIEPLHALGISRLRTIACTKDEQAKNIGETDCLLCDSLTNSSEGGAE